MFLTLELATSARELEFETDLDPKIDDVCGFSKSLVDRAEKS